VGPSGPRVQGKRGWFPPAPDPSGFGFVAEPRVITDGSLVPFADLAQGEFVSAHDKPSQRVDAVVQWADGSEAWELNSKRKRVRLTVRASTGR
jgi:hypothetical protein